MNLGQGFPDFDGPEFAKRAAIEAIERGENQYAPMSGIPELGAAIAAGFQQETGLEIDPATWVTVTSGCTEAIAATLVGLTDPGDEVILLEPFYDSYPACLAMTDAVPRYLTLEAPDFAIDLDALAAMINDRTRCLLLNTPHNPCGRVYSRAELEGIAATGDRARSDRDHGRGLRPAGLRRRTHLHGRVARHGRAARFHFAHSARRSR